MNTTATGGDADPATVRERMAAALTD